MANGASVKELIVQLSLENDKFKREAQQSTQALNKVNKSAKQGASSVSSFGSSFKDAINPVNLLKGAVLAFAAVALVKTGKFLKDATQAFAQFQQSLQATEKQFGKSGAEIIEALDKVAKGTVSNADLITSANRALALNVTQDLGEMSQLLEIARVRGQALGVDTTQAFNDIVTGIGRGSPLILDNLGIITKGWDAEAKAAGQAFDAQFILNKVLSDGAELLGRTGDVALTNAEKFQFVSAGFDNLKVSVGALITEQLGRLADMMSSSGNLGSAFVFFEKALLVVNFLLSAVIGTFRTFANTTQLLVINPMIAIGQAAIKLKDRDFKGLNEVLKDFADNAKEDFADISDAFGNTRDDFLKIFEDLDGEADELLTKLIKIAEKKGGDAGKKGGKSFAEKYKSEIQVASAAIENAISGSFDVVSGVFENQLAELDAKRAQQEETQNEFRRQLAALDELENQQSIARIENERDSFVRAGNRKASKEKERQLERIKLEEQAEAAEKAAENRIANERARIKKKQFKADKISAIVQVGINTAQGISKAFATFGPPANFIFAAIAAAVGAAQTAVIAAKQPPEFQAGGVIRGLNGAAPGNEDGIIAAQNGEAVLNRGATAVLGEDAINALNDGRGISNQVTINVNGGNKEEVVETLNDYFRQFGGGRGVGIG